MKKEIRADEVFWNTCKFVSFFFDGRPDYPKFKLKKELEEIKSIRQTMFRFLRGRL